MAKSKSPTGPKPLLPENAVLWANAAEPCSEPRPGDYFQAMLILVAKGYGVEVAAEKLVAIGCPHSALLLQADFLVRMGRTRATEAQ